MSALVYLASDQSLCEFIQQLFTQKLGLLLLSETLQKTFSFVLEVWSPSVSQ